MAPCRDRAKAADSRGMRGAAPGGGWLVPSLCCGRARLFLDSGADAENRVFDVPLLSLRKPEGGGDDL